MELVTNADAVAARVGQLMLRQIPFGLSVGINNTLTKTRDNEIWLAYDRAFEVRSKNFFKHTHAIFRTSTKQFSKNGYMHGAIQESGLTAPDGASRDRIVKKGKPAKMGQIARQVTGGKRTPLVTGTIALPAKGRKKQISRTASGAVRTNQRPKQELARENVFLTKPNKKGVSWIIKRSKALINAEKRRKSDRVAGKKVRKLSEKARRVDKLFALLPSVNIKPIGYDPAGVASTAILRRAPREITLAFIRAIRSSKPIRAGAATAGAARGPSHLMLP